MTLPDFLFRVISEIKMIHTRKVANINVTSLKHLQGSIDFHTDL